MGMRRLRRALRHGGRRRASVQRDAPISERGDEIAAASTHSGRDAYCPRPTARQAGATWPREGEKRGRARFMGEGEGELELESSRVESSRIGRVLGMTMAAVVVVVVMTTALPGRLGLVNVRWASEGDSGRGEWGASRAEGGGRGCQGEADADRPNKQAPRPHKRRLSTRCRCLATTAPAAHPVVSEYSVVCLRLRLRPRLRLHLHPRLLPRRLRLCLSASPRLARLSPCRRLIPTPTAPRTPP